MHSAGVWGRGGGVVHCREPQLWGRPDLDSDLGPVRSSAKPVGHPIVSFLSQ